ncbi:hypothetical protein Q9233_001864 [Columba guinea]|nr:hypothetical protein Q9233_001864 [Columba guinea]
MNHVLTERIPATLEGFADVFQVTLGEKTTHSHGYFFGSLCADGEKGDSTLRKGLVSPVLTRKELTPGRRSEALFHMSAHEGWVKDHSRPRTEKGKLFMSLSSSHLASLLILAESGGPLCTSGGGAKPGLSSTPLPQSSPKEWMERTCSHATPKHLGHPSGRPAYSGVGVTGVCGYGDMERLPPNPPTPRPRGRGGSGGGRPGAQLTHSDQRNMVLRPATARTISGASKEEKRRPRWLVSFSVPRA